DLLNGSAFTADEMKYWSVQPGDYLEVMGTGLAHQIVSLVDGTTVKITPPLPYPLAATANYRVVRSPRVVGDETLKLPDVTVIDLKTNTDFNNPLPPVDTNLGTGFVDILFGPSGAVISRGVSTATINLWVRAPDLNNATDIYRGDPTIVAVFVRT